MLSEFSVELQKFSKNFFPHLFFFNIINNQQKSIQINSN